MQVLDLGALRRTPLVRQPFPYVIVPGFVRSEARAAINADYPRIDSPGSFPVSQLRYGPVFGQFLAALQGPELRALFEEKFGVDLAGRPTMITVRGQCGPRDGRIHTDTESKILTVLLYMNQSWEEKGGQLRLLRSGDNLDDVIAEVPPVEGTLLAFRRTDNSWHGHKPFVGPRRVVQLNWITDAATVRRELFRHRVSAWLKRMRSVFASGGK
jgi:SM-20-related protein